MLLFWAYVVNSSACGAMIVMQQIDLKRGIVQARGSVINGTTRKYLHWQDFKSQLFGCTLFLPMLLSAFMQLCIQKSVTLNQLLIGAGIGVIGLVGFVSACLGKNHVPDSQYGIGKINRGGMIHAAYLGFYIMVGVVTGYNMFIGKLSGNDLHLPLIGAFAYGFTLAWDAKQGKFKGMEVAIAIAVFSVLAFA